MSTDLLAAVKFLLILAIPVVAIVLLVYFQRKAQLDAWNELAVRTGLTCEGGIAPWSPIHVSGSYHGRPLVLDTFTRGTGKRSRTYTRAVLGVNNPIPLQLYLSEESVFDKVGKWMGSKDIQLGDEALDRRYKIKGEPEEEVGRVLASLDVRQKLSEAPSMRVEIQAGEVHAEKFGVTKKVEELEKMFGLLNALAEGVERIGGA